MTTILSLEVTQTTLHVALADGSKISATLEQRNN